ncbi:hypothetical protein Patl1_03331 [Pistacia atlantica]|uniref:Uncharacterized protein n=1 Tax=Pistacia atlantica TaxID=434234 RepID=A0ACC1C7B7_9ROSI|nr:hypothetical protein Patl1_03331 [Pistacia atlantica]
MNNSYFACDIIFLPYCLIYFGLFLFPLFLAAGPKDTPMDLVLDKTYDAKTGKGMPDL